MGPLRLSIAPRQANVRVARMVAASACRLAELPDTLIDDVRLAVGEACGRAVLAHHDHGSDQPVEVVIEVDGTQVSVTVRRQVPAAGVPAAGSVGRRGVAAGEVHDRPAGGRHEPADRGRLSDALAMPDPLEIITGLADKVDLHSDRTRETLYVC